MKRGKSVFSILTLSIIVSIIYGCGGGGRTIVINKSQMPNTYQCEYMEDICKEAREFETKWNNMTPEERKNAKEIMRTYRQQCNDAIDACLKSGKKEGDN